MMLVVLALLPTTLFGLYVFGWPAIFLFLVTLVSALAFEAMCLFIAQKSISRYLFDGSALLTGWLVAMTLPPWAPWWIGSSVYHDKALLKFVGTSWLVHATGADARPNRGRGGT